ncbi:MAG TPA: EAL domain-containing protein [Thermoanaerobaculia bacterium]|nr:EAL domain-containing protein [Thermoanaerobaculia bacterium]
MPEFNLVTVITSSAQTVAAIVMAVLLLGFQRQYRKTYVRHWTLSWAALAAYYVCSSIGMGLGLGYDMPSAHPVRLLTATLAGIFGYTTIVWLLFGIYELLRRRPVRIRFYWRTLAAVAAFGVITALLFVGPDAVSSTRYFVRIGIRSLIASLAYLGSSIAFWQVRKRRRGVGFTMFSVALLLYGLQQAYLFGASIGWRFLAQSTGTIYLGYVGFLLQAITGMSMIACLLEDEREASELATVEMEHLAYHDALTGLPNRPLFMDRLIMAVAQASRSNQKIAVFFLDLDRFKDINDSLGHSMGDGLLKAVAERIRRCVREGDTVARFGGDEFTLLIPRIDHIDDAAKIAQKILETLKIPFSISDHELFVTTSVGISIYPNDGGDPETLVRNADSAMYRAKDQGRDNYQLYAPAMNARALERLALENMLRKAISHRELVLFYQPIADMKTKTIVGVEALIRWKHPELGLLSPAHFISVAETSGLIIPIGDWVLRTACKQTKMWQKRLDSHLTVAVNLSARQFQQPNLAEIISEVLEETGLDAKCLELEITESNAMQNAENTIYTLRELKALGVRIAMDDFGTGYSSLNYLKRFPIDTLKLDQSFVREITTDPTDAAIATAVIAMAHSLDLKVIGEGVETEEQFAFLHKQKCDYIQGYLFSPPQAVENLETYLVERKAAVI